MKITHYIYIAALSLALTGCLDETFPESGMNQQQVEQSATAVEALDNAVARQMLYDGYNYSVCGYPGLMINRDVMVGQLPANPNGYDYFTWYSTDTELGDMGQVVDDIYNLYYGIILRANLVLRAIPEGGNSDTAPHEANARAYRALAYMDLVRMYEYKHTGFAVLDDQATAAHIYGLTVPLVDETLDETQARNNPRQPFYTMYRFIMDDLNRAEALAKPTKWLTNNKADKGVVYGLKARLWLEMGSRFERYPDDLATQVAKENDEAIAKYAKLGITTAADCYAKAAEYARKAIDFGYTPVTKEAWFDTALGFNTTNSAWMLSVQQRKDDMTSSDASWKSFTSFLCPETTFGIAGTIYQTNREIDRATYETISPDDWRRATWIDPNDAGDPDKASAYATILSADDWAMFPAYSGFKFRTGGKDMGDYQVGAAVDVPVMRVEEMYLIEAEALAHSAGMSAGMSALQSYLATYRYLDADKISAVNDLSDFDDLILDERCIEFWGEGIVYFDFKRMEHAVNTAYVGSNHSDNMQFTFPAGYVAPRMNICFPQSECIQNTAIKNNPNPSGIH